MSCVEPCLTKMSSNQIVLLYRTPMYSFLKKKQSNLLVLQKKKNPSKDSCSIRYAFRQIRFAHNGKRRVATSVLKRHLKPKRNVI